MKPALLFLAIRGLVAGLALVLLPLNTGDGLSWRYAAAVAQAAATSEKEAFEAAKELGTVEAWDAFLSNYPNGFHADLARAYVKKLAAPTAAPVVSAAPDAALGKPADERPCKEAAKLKSKQSDEPAKVEGEIEPSGDMADWQKQAEGAAIK